MCLIHSKSIDGNLDWRYAASVSVHAFHDGKPTLVHSVAITLSRAVKIRAGIGIAEALSRDGNGLAASSGVVSSRTSTLVLGVGCCGAVTVGAVHIICDIGIAGTHAGDWSFAASSGVVSSRTRTPVHGVGCCGAVTVGAVHIICVIGIAHTHAGDVISIKIFFNIKRKIY
jgi:hypothetical protein